MTREKLKYVYNLVVAAALAIGFAAGYTLKGRNFQTLSWDNRPVRAYDKHFPGARSRYNEIKREFSRGDSLKTDYRSTLVALRQAIKRQPGYFPYYTLLAKVYEDCYENLRKGKVSGNAARILAESLGLDPDLKPADLAEECRELALGQWNMLTRSARIPETDTFGDQWQVIREQHVNALTRDRNLRVVATTGGIVDLTPAYDVYAITRDHDRYVSNLSAFEKGPTFEEKHIRDVIRCPNHPEVPFQFPCLPHLSVEKTRTVREDVDFFCNAMSQDGQHLDINDVPAQRIHLLAFNVIAERRIVDSMVRVEFADGSMENYPVAVGPWMQSPELLRNVTLRSSLDPVFRDTEVHLCNGLELETMTSPIYMYHVVIDLGARKIIDKVIFQRHDPTTVGLKDEGIRDIRIVAMTLQ
jgi:hypothetical protein